MTFKIAQFFDIPVKLHSSFGLVILFIAYLAYSYQLNFVEILIMAGFMAIMFLCVVLHEYGHALSAKKYGISTKDIILSPIGGVARLHHIPENPKQELHIAIAGPLVNVAIAIILSLILLAIGDMSFDLSLLEELELDKFSDFIKTVIYLNIGLFAFNLIPAFPMDGGRILRALLAMKTNRLQATRIASIIGKVISIGFLLFGLYSSQYVMAAIGVFIYFMAGIEYNQLKITDLVNNKIAKDIMNTNFTKFHVADDYEEVSQKYDSSDEKNFLVFDGFGNLVGSVPELYIKDAKKEGTLAKQLGSFMSSKVASVNENMKLQQVIATMQTEGLAIVGVVDDNQLLGVIDRNMIMKYLKES
jgi:Zn-dependent protease